MLALLELGKEEVVADKETVVAVVKNFAAKREIRIANAPNNLQDPPDVSQEEKLMAHQQMLSLLSVDRKNSCSRREPRGQLSPSQMPWDVTRNRAI